ncbi:probable S-adenosylmethionine-dependent methyltransferase At5g38780 [Pomacea canaliculata]|uniref:probable S-adenosylmethionine-dependent methyltransferase At5g38780 n=1 Tax=Pomacea canaliculata TaxID=400727 RepID=UPI000D737576|nr:probable S-adenosylmethionine-dependent methyltransferase At5g38780 [Pomacea canaliculata]
MLKTVIPRLVNVTAACHLPCLHPTSLSLSTLQPATRREMPENTTDIKTPSFQYFWQPGSGYYGESLGRVNKSATDLCDEFVLSHIDLLPVPSPKGVFTIGDYGTCDGSVSLHLVNKIIEHLRKKHGPDLKIQVVYQDQPHNDYNSLFKTVYDKASYMSKFTNVFPLVCGTNFYKQCVPDDTCDIIVSTFATHYLSEDSHVRCSNTMFPWRSTSQEELRAHREAAARDWQTFLLHRAAELKPGGLLFDAQSAKLLGSNPPQTRTLTYPLAENFNRVGEESTQDIWTSFDLSWKELYVEGLITKEEFQLCTLRLTLRTLQEVKAPFENAAMSPEEFQSCTLRLTFRTLQEVKAPFENASMSPVPQAGLNLLEDPQEFLTYCPFKALWRQKLQTDGVDDRMMFAQVLAKAFYLVLDATLRNTLRNTRPAEDHLPIIQRLQQTFIQKVAALNPETFRSEIVVRILAAQKSK